MTCEILGHIIAINHCVMFISPMTLVKVILFGNFNISRIHFKYEKHFVWVALINDPCTIISFPLFSIVKQVLSVLAPWSFHWPRSNKQAL